MIYLFVSKLLLAMEKPEVDLRVVYSLIKNGTLLNEVGKVPAELLKPYFPSLISATISAQKATASAFVCLQIICFFA